MAEHEAPARAAPGLWGLEIASAFAICISVLLLIAGAVLGLFLYHHSVKLKLGDNRSVELLLAGFLGGVMLGGIVFCCAMILVGLKSQIILMRNIQRATEQTRLGIGSLEKTMLELGPMLGRGVPAAAISQVPEAAKPQASGLGAADVARLVAAISELRDVALMGDGEKQAVIKHRLEQKRQAIVDRCRHHLRHEEWPEAKGAIDEVKRLFPSDGLEAPLTEELAFARQRKIDRDLNDAQDRVRGWVSTNRWDLVEPLITKLELTYPDDASVMGYVQQVRGEMQGWHKEEFHNLIAQLKDAGDHRQWRRASLIAQQILEKYPDEKMVEKLRAELPAIRKNADIQEVKDLESQFKELLQRRRYDEAMPIAQKVIDHHPETAVAAELVKMLPKLQELMKQDKLRREAAVGKEMA